ncbi:uncharacterized protein RAG0_04372 [Rhynchosporium agropyri]|uniref:Uncharacterized protein n=1 Tax=Rhynchosporium agropyri TaxID=914238 RepID=A0A1E1K8F2_9HELO|nr:uncharacterized protein RAG0_04372 [Rhynchosporium agropyri]
MARDTSVPNVVEWEDRLWARNIIHEHQQLSQQIQDIAAKRDEDIQKVTERCDTAYETSKEALGRLEELENEVKVRNQQVDEHTEELKNSLESIMEFLRPRLTPEELSSVDLIRYTSSKVPPSGRTFNNENQTRTSTESPVVSGHTRPPPRAAVRKSSYLVPQNPDNQYTSAIKDQHVTKPSNSVLSSDGRINKPNDHVGTDIHGSTTNLRKRPTATRPTVADPPRSPPMRTRSRSRTESREERSAVQLPSAPESSSLQIPKLSQKRRPLIVYYEEATAIRETLGLEVGQPEYDFALAFIDGISTKKIANQLFDSLANFCDSGTKVDGSKFVNCEWEEVLQGIKLGGLDVLETVQDKGKGWSGEPRVEFPGLMDFRAVESPILKGKQPATSGPNATEGREHHELLMDPEITGQSGGKSSPTSVVKANSGKVRFDPTVKKLAAAARASKSKGKTAARRSPVKKPATGSSKSTEKSSAKGGRAGQAAIEKPGTSRGRAAKGLNDPGGDTAGAGTGAQAGPASALEGAGNATGNGRRRGPPRKANH